MLCASDNRERVRISTTVWPVLAMVDSQRSVAEIAAALGHEPLEIGMALSQLIARGLVNLKPPQQRVANEPARPTPAQAARPAAQQAATSRPRVEPERRVVRRILRVAAHRSVRGDAELSGFSPSRAA